MGLTEAARRGDKEAVRGLLDSGAAVDSVDRRGWTALMRAADRADEALLALLLARGADPNVRRRNGRSALFSACQRGPLASVERLIKAGAEFWRPDAQGVLPLDLAADSGRPAVIPAVGRPKSQYSGALQRPLAKAAARALGRRRLEVVRSLLECIQFGNLYSALNRFAHSDLVALAVQTGDSQLVTLVLDYLDDRQVRKGEPVAQALQMHRHDLVQKLRERGFPYRIDEAIMAGRLDLVERCLDTGISLHSLSANRDENLLQLAAKHGRSEILREFARRGANINLVNWSTPLDTAVHYKQWQTVDCLLELGANPNAPSPDHCAFTSACAWAPLAVMERLVEHGATPNSPAGLVMACRFDRPDAVRYLLDHGTDANAIMPHERSPLGEAALHGHAEIVALLLERGADPTLPSGEDCSLAPEVWASIGGRRRVRILLSQAR